MARKWLLALGLVLVAGSCAWGQQAHTIRLKRVGQGETTHHEDTLTTEVRTRQVDTGGQVLADHRDHSVRSTVYEETVLKQDQGTGQIRQLRRVCSKARLEVNGMESYLPYHGKAFVVERGPDRCEIRFEGEAPSAEFVRQLEEGFHAKKEASPLNAMLPINAVQAGQSWAFDPRPLLTAWPKPAQVRLDLAKATGTGKLTRTYQKGERLFGVLEFRVEAPVVGVAFGTREAAPRVGARLAVAVDVEACIDGSASTFNLRMTDELTVKVDLPGPQGKKIEGTISEQHFRTESRP
jgi:hypothetical protein